MPQRKKGNQAAKTTQFIVKKKLYEGDGGHHGGIWKIAYADFMTAMMTFFLVMWLVNSSSKEKITTTGELLQSRQTDRSQPRERRSR